MTFHVRQPSFEPDKPGPPVCRHDHPTIQDAVVCAKEQSTRLNTVPVIYDVETNRVLDAFEIEDAHRQDHDDCGDHTCTDIQGTDPSEHHTQHKAPGAIGRYFT